MARILVIDDEILVRATIEAVLSTKGHAVSLAVNGRDAMAKLRGGEFDLVITDLIMPEMEGIETILAIRKELPGLHILAISGGGRMQAGDFLDMAGKLGADGVLRKPFTPEELLDAVARAVAAQPHPAIVR